MAGVVSNCSSVRPLVLIVDDCEETLAMYAFVLSVMGFDVLTARNLAEAYPFARRTRPDIIVTEVAGRAVQGWDLLTTVKGDALMGDIAVVVVTSDARASTRERAMRDGCAAFYTKPCPPDALAAGLWGLVAAQRV